MDDWIYLQYPPSANEPNCRYSLSTQAIQIRYETEWYDVADDPQFRQEIEEMIRAR